MGREVKRVPIDFDWPQKVTWPGYQRSPCDKIEQSAERAQQDKCELCRHWARLAGIELRYDCPALEIEPPAGDGWQMWENTSDGSPISPAFETPEELARWLADTGASACARQTATYDEWLAMIRQGWAPDMVYDGGRLMTGVADASANIPAGE